MRAKLLLLSLLSWTLCTLGAQTQSSLGVGVDFGGLLRGGNWAKSYGPGLSTAFRGEYGLKNGWLGSLQAELIYGNQVKFDPLIGLRSDVGILGDEAGEARPVEIVLKSRGFRASFLVGRYIPLGMTGLSLRALAGPSYLQHKLRIQDDATLTTSNLRKEYKRGYDRLAAGWGGSGELGLQYKKAGNDAAFFLVAQGHIARTTAMRKTQFDVGMAAPGNAWDSGIALKVGILATLFDASTQREADQIYY